MVKFGEKIDAIDSSCHIFAFKATVLRLAIFWNQICYVDETEYLVDIRSVNFI